MSLDTRPNSSRSDFQYHGPIARVLLAALGAAFLAAGTGSAVLLFYQNPLRGSPVQNSLQETLVALGIPFLFIGIAAYGVNLVLRAIRGRSKRRFERAQAWYLSHWYSILLVTCGVLAGVGIARIPNPCELVDFLLGSDGSRFYFAWIGLLFFLVLPIHVALHELGHAAAGALVKFRFSSLRIGKVTLYRDRTKLRISWSGPAFPDLFGLHHGVPEGEEALGARYAVYYLGGPAVTVALALICRMASQSLSPPSTLGSTVVLQLLWAGWLVGAYLACVNLLPLRLGAVTSDGAKILSTLLCWSPAAKAARRSRVLSVQGRRPREWGMSAEYLLRSAKGSRRHRDELLLAALQVALDIGDKVQANEVLHRAALVGALRNPLVGAEFELQAAMVDALSGKPSLARERISRLGRHPTVPGYERLAEAAVQLMEGRTTEARMALNAWNEALTRTGMAVGLRVGNEWAEEAIQARLDVAGG